MSERWKVVIVGGDWWAFCSQQLNSDLVDVTLIYRRNYHLFPTLLYQVARARLRRRDCLAARSVLSRPENTRVWLGTVVDVDTRFETPGASRWTKSLRFLDRCRWAHRHPTSTQTSGKSGLGMKSIEKPLPSRHKILYASSGPSVSRIPSGRRAWLTFVMVGAGPTGVELSGPSPRSRAQP